MEKNPTQAKLDQNMEEEWEKETREQAEARQPRRLTGMPLGPEEEPLSSEEAERVLNALNSEKHFAKRPYTERFRREKQDRERIAKLSRQGHYY